jgi:polyisoprenoid-binding protein YceI
VGRDHAAIIPHPSGESVPTSLTLGPTDGDLLLFTTAEGKAARLGHALTLRVGTWEATVVHDGGVPESVTVTAQLSSLEVVVGKGGVKPLSDKDKRTILEGAGKTLGAARFPQLTFTSSTIDGADVVHGDVDLHGAVRPVDVQVSRDGDTLTATTTIAQTEFGISPYSQMMGALQVGDAVAIRLEVTLPA